MRKLIGYLPVGFGVGIMLGAALAMKHGANPSPGLVWGVGAIAFLMIMIPLGRQSLKEYGERTNADDYDPPRW